MTGVAPSDPSVVGGSGRTGSGRGPERRQPSQMVADCPEPMTVLGNAAIQMVYRLLKALAHHSPREWGIEA